MRDDLVLAPDSVINVRFGINCEERKRIILNNSVV